MAIRSINSRLLQGELDRKWCNWSYWDLSMRSSILSILRLWDAKRPWTYIFARSLLSIVWSLKISLKSSRKVVNLVGSWRSSAILNWCSLAGWGLCHSWPLYFLYVVLIHKLIYIKILKFHCKWALIF